MIYMRQTLLVPGVIAVLLLVVPATAQGTDVEIKPGTIKADSPLHGIDTAFDDMMVNLNRKDPSDVAFERASEMRDLQERDQATSERVKKLSTSVEKQSQISVETAGGKNVNINSNGDISISGPDGSVDISGGDIKIRGPDGSVDIGSDGIDVQGPDGSVSITDGKIDVQGPDGSVSIDAQGIKVQAQQRKVKLQQTRIVMEQVYRDAPGDMQQSLQTTVQQVQQHEQSLDRVQSQIEQKMNELQ